jgi:hypothetical protein
VYVLQLQGNRYYIGKSQNTHSRIAQHKHPSGYGSRWTTKYRIIKEVCPLTPSQEDLESWERAETLTRMLEHGIENVRGWMFTTEQLDEYQVEQVCYQVCEKFDLCRQCGGKGHFVSSCRASRPAKWMRDMGVEQQETKISKKKVFLKCSYADKEQAKALGASWDAAVRKWFVSPGHALHPFEQWM